MKGEKGRIIATWYKQASSRTTYLTYEECIEI